MLDADVEAPSVAKAATITDQNGIEITIASRVDSGNVQRAPVHAPPAPQEENIDAVVAHAQIAALRQQDLIWHLKQPKLVCNVELSNN